MKRLNEEELERRLHDASLRVTVGATYEHYKGGLYVVDNLVIQTPDDQACVIYTAKYGKRLTFARPLSEWSGTVSVDGTLVNRFTVVK